MVPRTSLDRPAPRSLTRALRDAAAFDASGLAPFAGLRAAVGLTAVLVIGIAAGGPPAAVVAATGALIAGIVSVTGGVRPPLVTMIVTALAQATSIFAGAATGNHPVIHVALLAVWAFAGGLLVALRPGATIVGLQAIVAIVVFGRFAEAPAGALRLAGIALAGAAFEITVTAVVRWPEALRAQRVQLATAYRSLAALARGTPGTPGSPSAEAADTADEVLNAQSLLARDDSQALRGLLDEARRIRLALLSLSGLRRRLTEDAGSAEVEAALVEIAAALDHVALALTSHEPASIERAHAHAARVSERAQRIAASDAPSAVTDPATAVVAAIAGQLRAVCGLLDEMRESSGTSLHLPHRRRRGMVLARIGSDIEQLHANLTPRSAAFRHATRMAVLVPLAAIAGQHSPLARSYWIPMTVALVLRPDFSGTFSRGAARMLGTVAGVAVTGIAVALLPPGNALSVALIGALAWGAYALFTASFAAAVACITAIVVLLLGLVFGDTLSAAVDRLIDTIVGGAIALAAYAVWPTWSAAEARAAVGNLIAAQRAYMRAVLDRIAGARDDDRTLATLARDARMARSNANAVVERSLREPSRHRVDQEQTEGVLVALRRVSETLHLLRTTTAETDTPRVPALRPLADGLDDAMATLASTLRDSGRPHSMPPLRRLHDRLRDEADASDTANLVVNETDELVDAVDTVGHLLGVER